MKNEHYILGSLPLLDTSDPMPLEHVDKEVLISSIRLGAHFLDLTMQKPHASVSANSQLRLDSHRRKIATFEQRFGGPHPDVQWAKKIGALFQTYIDAKGSFAYPYEPIDQPSISEVDFERLITGRRSVREFTGEADDGLLRRIIRYAQWAPTNCGLQALRYVVVRNEEIRRQLRYLGKHSTVCVVADLRVYPDNDIDCPYHDSGAAIQTLLLASHFLGLGACYISDLGVNSETNRSLLSIPCFEKITAIVLVGHCERVPLAPARSDVDEVIRYI